MPLPEALEAQRNTPAMALNQLKERLAVLTNLLLPERASDLDIVSTLSAAEHCVFIASSNVTTTPIGEPATMNLSVQEALAASITSGAAALRSQCGLTPTECSLGGKFDSCIFQPNLPLRERAGLFSRYDAALNISRSRDPMIEAAQLLEARNHAIVFGGDSVSNMLVRHASCKLQSAGYDPNLIREIKIGQSPSSVTAALNRTMARMQAQGGGIVIFNSGLHFNAHHRYSLRRIVNAALPLLEKFALACPRCMAVLSTTSAQHFRTPTGAYDTGTLEAPFTGLYECAALQSERNSPGGKSPGVAQWRRSELVDAAGRAPHVLLLDFEVMTRHLWDAHIGDTSQTTSHKQQGAGVLDCTHFCPGPWLYEPFWWAIHEILRS